jgi:hypothetical protein
MLRFVRRRRGFVWQGVLKVAVLPFCSSESLCGHIAASTLFLLGILVLRPFIDSSRNLLSRFRSVQTFVREGEHRCQPSQSLALPRFKPHLQRIYIPVGYMTHKAGGWQSRVGNIFSSEYSLTFFEISLHWSSA